jgi:hypothetical protein
MNKYLNLTEFLNEYEDHRYISSSNVKNTLTYMDIYLLKIVLCDLLYCPVV